MKEHSREICKVFLGLLLPPVPYSTQHGLSAFAALMMPYSHIESLDFLIVFVWYLHFTVDCIMMT